MPLSCSLELSSSESYMVHVSVLKELPGNVDFELSQGMEGQGGCGAGEDQGCRGGPGSGAGKKIGELWVEAIGTGLSTSWKGFGRKENEA